MNRSFFLHPSLRIDRCYVLRYFSQILTHFHFQTAMKPLPQEIEWCLALLLQTVVQPVALILHIGIALRRIWQSFRDIPSSAWWLRFWSRQGTWNPEGKVVVIVGASSGIGASMAHQLARESGRGLRLVLCARRAEELQKVAQECRALYSAAKSQTAATSKEAESDQELVVITEQVDVGNLQQVERFLRDRVGKIFGHIDALVLNAGLSMGESILDLQDDCLKVTFANADTAPCNDPAR